MMRINTGDYATAKQALQSILGQPVFHEQTKAPSIWERALVWIGRHLHFSISTGTWQTAGYVLAGILFLLVLFMLIWWMLSMSRSGTRRVVVPWLKSDTREDALSMAQRHLDEGNCTAALEDLVDACLLHARDQGWCILLPHITLRTYARQFAKSAQPAFTQVFAELSQVVEQVLFNEQSLSQEDTEQWIQTVRQTVLRHAS